MSTFLPDGFRPLTLDDCGELSSVLFRSKEESCEFCLSNLCTWGPASGLKVQFWHDRLYLHFEVLHLLAFTVDTEKNDEPTAGELAEAANAMRAAGFDSHFFQVRQATLDAAPDLGRYFEITPSSDDIDEYIYSPEELFELRGKLLSKKRNLIAQFERDFAPITVEELGEQNLDECVALSRTWGETYPGNREEIDQEFRAISRMKESFRKTGSVGVLIRSNGKAVAYATASPITHKIWSEPFEKGLHEYKGASQFANHELARLLIGKCELLNREQDLGVPGMRQAKRSYQPIRILKNYELTLKK